jgi:hypothetical protein
MRSCFACDDGGWNKRQGHAVIGGRLRLTIVGASRELALFWQREGF